MSCIQLTVCFQTQTSPGHCEGSCHWSRREWCLGLWRRLVQGSPAQSAPREWLSPAPSACWWSPWPCRCQRACCRLFEMNTYSTFAFAFNSGWAKTLPIFFLSDEKTFKQHPKKNTLSLTALGNLHPVFNQKIFYSQPGLLNFCYQLFQLKGTSSWTSTQAVVI